MKCWAGDNGWQQLTHAVVNDQTPAWGPSGHQAHCPVPSQSSAAPAPHSAPAWPRQIGLITPTSSRAEQIEKWIIAKIACFQDLCQSKLTLGQCRGLMGTFKLILWPLSELMANAVPTSTQSSDPILTPIISNCVYLFREHWILFYEVSGGWLCDNESVLIALILLCPHWSACAALTSLLPVSHGISSGDGSQSLLTSDNHHQLGLSVYTFNSASCFLFACAVVA